jgi:TolB-like protein
MSFIRELKRRNVFRVGIAYAVVAWLILQLSDVLISMLNLPDWVGRLVILLITIGFPLALIFAWAFELTPDGIKRDQDVGRSASVSPVTGRKLDFVIIAALVMALGFVIVDQYVMEEQGPELEKSIAVLPFANRSALPEDAYFVDGIHDDILTQLSNLSGIEKVISRTTMARYRDTDKSVPEIAAELGVAAIVEGSVQRAGGTIRVTIQLISAPEDEHLWAKNYDRQLNTDNIFAIQSEIAAAIADSLHATLTAGDAKQLETFPTDNLDAYDAYLLGKHAMADRTLHDIRRARSFFESAVEIDPQFALAQVGIADTANLTVGTPRGASQHSRVGRLECACC